MLLLDLAACVAIGALSGMGVGGGGLLVIYLTIFRNYAQLDAQAANLLFFIFAAGAALFVHLKKREIDYRTTAVFAISGIVGSLFGSSVTALVPENLTGKIFGAMLAVSGTITLVKSLRSSRKSSAERR